MKRRPRATTVTLAAKARCQHCAWQRRADDNKQRLLARKNAAMHAMRWQHSVTWVEKRVLLGWKA